MTRSLVSVPGTARRGDIVDVRAMIAHPMETGYRMGPNGVAIPRRIITRFVCTYGGEEVFAAAFFPAVSANPFVSFSLVATESGTVGFAWTDDEGQTETASAEIVVS
ncbi:thiosulfate oxidation carrier complex protein SoxZ [Ancylobacter dichloromethanicus]|uniref:Thiosulfate oxidation carrier complex protein SoxZ n=1 Tax=Ancylobacter dichloromethanicus TaxID=518825 RepID=A0A9W6J659_9HYPH|nr:thiosulfate oxidation carrier complex protein SoxZ [Ancylobacter dichloromethanicus]MBS7556359.1 thiosulfate oxidation carrier complex protein SoxZ [Ancylobacter dichloromethanicus]GLK70124.1 thiosulfate oxidation carrier complex protein SoxZ [Ancylobacter dichloromethanicus]